MGYSEHHGRPAATASSGLRVVVIGGGTGLSTLLKGTEVVCQSIRGSTPSEIGETRNFRS